MSALNDKIKKTKKGGILELAYGEFHEQVVLKNDITIRSNNIPVTVVGKSPTLSIESNNIILENINIVNTDDSGICLNVKKGCNPVFKNVLIKGKVVGLEDEEGDWDIPNVLELAIIPNQNTKNIFIINCPVPATIYPYELHCINCDSDSLDPGFNQIEISISELCENNLISGDLIIETRKHHLKRKIAVHGNTLNPIDDKNNYDGKCIWVCKSVNANINTKVLDKLPEGLQDKLYSFELDEDELNCKDYEISIEGLPNGITFNITSKPFKIEGTSKNHGKYQVCFSFRKEDFELKHVVELKIIEKQIIPLEISEFPQSIIKKEDELIEIKMKILASNSPNIKFIIEKELPEGLQLNDKTGEIKGKVIKHGTYDSVIKIEDDVNKLFKQINFTIVPKDLLRLESTKNYQVYIDDDINLPIHINDFINLSPEISFSIHPSATLIHIEKIKDCYLIKGTLSKLDEYKIQLNIRDIYDREINETILIKCIGKPQYNIKWHTVSPIECEGEKGKDYSQNIHAIVEDNPKIILKYECVEKIPTNIKLLENGLLTVTIDEESSWSIIVRAFSENSFSEKEFIIKTKIASIRKEHISRFVDGVSTGTAFSELNQVGSIKDALKDVLIEGTVNKNYRDIIFKELIPKEVNIILSAEQLPEGIRYNPKEFTVEGIPSKAGTYFIDIFNDNQSKIKQISIKIRTEETLMGAAFN